MRRVVVRRFDGQSARRHRRHRQHALWRRHLGLARRRHWRRSGLAGRQGACAATCWRWPAPCCKPSPTTSTSATASWSTKRPAPSALPLDELARVAYFRPDTLPPGFQAELMATRHYVPRAWPFAFTNGIQASYLEVDTDTGFVKLLKHWCVEDCGTIINPQLVDEQIRGGVVQGIGAALVRSSASMTSAARCSTATWPTIWCRWRSKCPTSSAATWSRPPPTVGARRQGRGRSRHRRRAGRGDERHQRRAAPARRADAHRHAVHARTRFCGRWARCDQNLIMSLRVSVTFGPMPPVPFASSQARDLLGIQVFRRRCQSTGTMTLNPRTAAALAV